MQTFTYLALEVQVILQELSHLLICVFLWVNNTTDWLSLPFLLTNLSETL